MTNNPFQKAVKSQARLRLALDGPSGSGKTYTALTAATALANGGQIAVIDTERGSASLYADLFAFDVVALNNFSPVTYTEMIHAAEAAGYSVIVIDSLSHAWEGEGGALDLVDDAARRSKSGNSFTAWKDITPLHRRMVDAMLTSKCHVIVTMRSKSEYVIEEIERNGRKIQVPKKVGMAPIQRAGIEYEFTVVGDLDVDHNLVITKSRMAAIDNAVVARPKAEWFSAILAWLEDGAPAPEAPAAPATDQPPANHPTEPANGNAELAKALELRTQRGTRLGDMTIEQLKYSIEHSTNGFQAGARLVLAHRLSAAPSADDWQKWFDLVESAAGKVSTEQVAAIDPPNSATLGDLMKSYGALTGLIEAAGQPA